MTADLIRAPVAAANTPAIVDTDHQVIELWLNGLSAHTQRAYRHDSNLFFANVQTPLREVTLGQLQNFAAHLTDLKLSPNSKHRALSAIKSLVAFAARLGYLQFDVATPLRLPPNREKLSERILEESEVKKMIAGETNPRNHLILLLLYVAGLRVSELANLRWSDLQPHRGAGQLTIFGKGGKTRAVRIDGQAWLDLQSTRGPALPADPIFASTGVLASASMGSQPLCTGQLLRIVRKAAARAGITKPVSPHWLRHCHCSHALDNGAPIHLVQQTVGHSSIATTSRYLHARPSESSSSFIPSV